MMPGKGALSVQENGLKKVCCSQNLLPREQYTDPVLVAPLGTALVLA